MATKTFASQYQRDEHGWILFPRDVEERRKYYPPEVFKHPAKANLFLIQELTRYLTKPGDSIVDPFGGTGTQLMAAWEDRNVVLIELEPTFQEVIEAVIKDWSGRQPPPKGDIYLYKGDNRQVLPTLPFLCDASIFSPPYSQALQASTGFTDHKESLEQYGGKQASALNMGRLNPFYYEREIEKVYQRLSKRLVANAPIAILTKDIMKGPVRVFISEVTIRGAQRNGLKLEEWLKWKPPGSMMHSVVKAKGGNVVDEEDILVFVKE